jgi:hypothetical protein
MARILCMAKRSLRVSWTDDDWLVDEEWRDAAGGNARAEPRSTRSP